MLSTFPSTKKQAENILKVITDGDHKLHQLALQVVTVEQFIRIIELSEKGKKI